jgi:hypothetical protein
MKRSFGNEDERPRVGYCSPPQSTRFKKGVSANPWGRPRGSTHQNTFEKVIRKKLTVIEGGKQLKLSAEEILYKKLLKAAIDGDASARRDLLRLIERMPKEKVPEDGASTTASALGVIFMKDSTELLLALGICIQTDGRCVLSCWAIEAARERQGWAPLSEEDEKLLDDFGEPGVKRAA